MIARRIMSSTYHSLHPAMPISEAVAEFQRASIEEDRRIFGMMVIDQQNELVGILSMHDILTLLQPKHVHIWGEMDDIDVSGLIATMCRKSHGMVVGDIMSTGVITVSADTHLFGILEIMNKHHIRRIPVTDNGRVIGIVYLSDLFFHLVEQIRSAKG